jgi:hypothetical protein
MLANLLRGSRLTLLFGQAGSGKSGLLQHEVLPLLEGPLEVAVLFNSWGQQPLTDLQLRIENALDLPHHVASNSLCDVLQTAKAQRQTRLLILLDDFDQHLLADPKDLNHQAFAHSLKAAMHHTDTLAHFFIAVRDESQMLLEPWRREVRGFGDRWIRIRPWQTLVPVAPEPVAPAAFEDDERTVLDPRYLKALQRTATVPPLPYPLPGQLTSPLPGRLPRPALIQAEIKNQERPFPTPLPTPRPIPLPAEGKDAKNKLPPPHLHTPQAPEVDIYLPLANQQEQPPSQRVQSLWDELLNRAISPAQANNPPVLSSPAPKRGPWLSWLHRKR